MRTATPLGGEPVAREESRTSVTGGINKAGSEVHPSVAPRPTPRPLEDGLEPTSSITRDHAPARMVKRHRDVGVTFVEVLVTLVLIGMAVVAVLAAVRATVVATRVNRDHTSATAWLQSASDVLAGRRLTDCMNGVDAVLDDYGAAIDSVPSSEGWPPDRLRVASVAFWTDDGWGVCTSPYNLQLVTLHVIDADGAVLERLEIVKGSYVGEVDGGA